MLATVLLVCFHYAFVSVRPLGQVFHLFKGRRAVRSECRVTVSIMSYPNPSLRNLQVPTLIKERQLDHRIVIVTISLGAPS
jgi:hypothetical protein